LVRATGTLLCKSV